MRQLRRISLLVAAAIAAVGVLPVPVQAAELRGGMTALVAGAAAQDPQVAQLAGAGSGDLVYFAVLSEPNDGAHAAALELLGADVLRSYRSVNAFALASPRLAVASVAAVSWVQWLTPVQLVHTLDDPVPLQGRATTADIGATTLWNAGYTGSGMRIAVLDTGIDVAQQDLDDLDFRHWTDVAPRPSKLVGAQTFLNNTCTPGVEDGHGHGTHVAAIATGTGEGNPLLTSDNGAYLGIAPDAQLAVGKVMTDAGTGINSDLVAALEWAALPAGTGPVGCQSVGADVVNLSLGSESRPGRLNSGSDVDFVSFVADRLAVRYGTTIVAAVGNSGPFVGSVLEAPGSASQVLSVAATAKDYDLSHNDTLSGDTCAGWQPTAAQCAAGTGTQRSSISSFSSRGPSGDLWLRPDVAAPGYNIVSAQTPGGTAINSNDLNAGTRADSFYATASGTSMASPAAAGSAALVLQSYRARYGASPQGASGVTGLPARAYALVRAALMNTARSDLYESRWILTVGSGTGLSCPPEVDTMVFGLCSLGIDFANLLAGSQTLYEVRNGASDPFVGPLAEGAGKIDPVSAANALSAGVVAYSAASGSGDAAGTGPRDLQGSWQIGAITAGVDTSQRFVLHAAPAAGPLTATFAFTAGNPSDSSRPITTGKGAWTINLPERTRIGRGGDAIVTFRARVPATAAPASYSGAVLVSLSNGQVLHVPVYASVALHDGKPGPGSGGPQSAVGSARDVFAKADTLWPYLGASPTGTGADWLVYPVELASGLTSAVFSVYDTSGDATFDLYVYDANLNLVASTHPFLQPGVTDTVTNSGRGPTTSASPQTLTVPSPAAGRYYVAVNRAKLGSAAAGGFDAFLLMLDER
jgi:subtilisin family serine protease